MMAGESPLKLEVDTYDSEQKVFYLKNQNSEVSEYVVNCDLQITGVVDGISRSVNKDQPPTAYSFFRFVNPYLNAQNDVFRLRLKDSSIGYVFPFSALEDIGGEKEFDEFKQAYRYYCVKHIIEQFDFNKSIDHAVKFSELVQNKEAIYFIVCQPLLKGKQFNIFSFLPCLALKGYYYFPNNTQPNVLTTSIDGSKDVNFEKMIGDRFILKNRGKESLNIFDSKIKIDEEPILRLLYGRLLIESNNPLHRFLVLYQVVEFLVDKRIRMGINEICDLKDSFSNYDFFQQIYDLNNARTEINKLFNGLSFDEKEEITGILKSFITESNPTYNKHSAGDCFYDIRNLLFHDFRSVLKVNNDGLIPSLVVQCELFIHNLIISIEHP